VCCSQDTQLTVLSGISLGQGGLRVTATQHLQPALLPLKSAVFLSENCIAAAGAPPPPPPHCHHDALQEVGQNSASFLPHDGIEGYHWHRFNTLIEREGWVE